MNEESKSEAIHAANEARPLVPTNGRRKTMVAALFGVFALAGAAYGAYWALVSRYQIYTDNAYVEGNVVQITPQVAGTAIAIGADNTDVVKAGQILVQLDPSDALVTLQQAEAQLAKTVRQVRSLFATSSQLQASVQMRESDRAKAQEDLARRERLAASGAISGEEINHARDALKGAQAALVAAREQFAANRALVDQTTVETHPDVRNAAARVREAYLAYSRTKLPAPVSGVVAKRSVELGQRVAPGAPLMAVVPIDQVWVNANFKEPQLAALRIGQPVKLTADLYGDNFEYRGRVEGMGAGTGSAFSLLPAQNATGNWIKVVQRVPVRIAIDPAQLASHPLRIGLSMQATVDIHDKAGPVVAEAPRASPAYATAVFDTDKGDADMLIGKIVRANVGEADGGERDSQRVAAAKKVPDIKPASLSRM
ncbi:MAG TPA: HlyD family efflux transporter periplasmic adaptor subunit [Usitatibacter sp.]|nr:HlyD family efflux transporter periplasmic adaptor subunit [Usitatibacter sp.]